MTREEQANRVLEWRESLIKLSDYHFFELIRMYLGEVKTPYNKQKLVEELSSFLRKEENKKVIAKLLSKEDVLILTAIKNLTKPSQDKLSLFFANEFSFADLFERLLNLEERLLIFRKTDNFQSFFALNPLLENLLTPFLDLNYLIPQAQNKIETLQTSVQITPLLISSIFSFFFYEKDVIKADGTLKKRAETLVKSIFPFVQEKNGMIFFLTLIDALKNLNLFAVNNSELKPNYKKWLNFANLSQTAQIAYICAASCGKFTRETLQNYAQLTLNIANYVPKNGCSKNVLNRCAIIQKENQSSIVPLKKSRLSFLLQEEPQTIQQDNSVNVEILIDKMICLKAFASDGENYILNRELFTELEPNDRKKTFLTLSADFSVMILPGLSLKELLSLMTFLYIESFDTVPRFGITRESCTLAFDLGFSDKEIMETLCDFTNHSVSQNLSFSIEDWFKTYNSATLYKGYVLKIAKEKQFLIENNENLKPFILENLAEGIYLLDFADDEEASDTMKKANLGFIGAVKQAQNDKIPISLRELAFVEQENIEKSSKTQETSSEQEKTEFFKSMEEELLQKNFNEEQIDGLNSRISRKIIINANQLRGDSVRFEKIEASGMDFLGKIHIVEHAISSDSMIEIAYDGFDEHILGTPLSIEKRDNDAFIKLKTQPEGDLQIFSVSKANFIKRIRGSIFKESGNF